ncbi:unnamed protein product [Polarella glacialis]|uniref:Uncharacterized protein n=1 Tax=Polarella glacialis TaxID=89957 RepID=A0A813INX3_POLGL|nr:unnamed protein product [Polarella glacialis]
MAHSCAQAANHATPLIGFPATWASKSLPSGSHPAGRQQQQQEHQQQQQQQQKQQHNNNSNNNNSNNKQVDKRLRWAVEVADAVQGSDQTATATGRVQRKRRKDEAQKLLEKTYIASVAFLSPQFSFLPSGGHMLLGKSPSLPSQSFKRKTTKTIKKKSPSLLSGLPLWLLGFCPHPVHTNLGFA